MITVISGTNRHGNLSIKIAHAFVELLTSKNVRCQLLDLQKLPPDFVFQNDVYGNADPGFTAISEQFVGKAEKFVFVIPEYNGSYPGVCKAFIDSVWPEHFRGKKAAMVGLSSGRAGNLRGTDQLTAVMHYLQVAVLPQKVNILHVDGFISEKGHFEHEPTLALLDKLADGIVGF